MVIKDFSGDFLKADSIEDGDIIEVMDEGKDEFNQALNKTIYNLSVKKGDKVMKWSPNNESGRIMQQAYGNDSKDWVGKKIQIFKVGNSMKIKPIKV